MSAQDLPEKVEKWKDIEGYEGFYRVSDLGNVQRYRLDNTFENIYGSKVGYKTVILWSRNKKTKSFKVHRLVAQAFIPNPNNHPQVNHKNGIIEDNQVENLEWCNQSQNSLHMHQVLNHGKGTKEIINAKSVTIETSDGKIIYDDFESLFTLKPDSSGRAYTGTQNRVVVIELKSEKEE